MYGDSYIASDTLDSRFLYSMASVGYNHGCTTVHVVFVDIRMYYTVKYVNTYIITPAPTLVSVTN